MDIYFGRDPFTSALSQLLHSPEDKNLHPSARNYVRDTKAMFNTAVDVKELPNSYVFIADMPGLKSGDIKVQVENDNVLTIGGERKREEPSAEEKYLRMERPAGKFLKTFTLPQNAKLDAIEASCVDGVLKITIPKIPPRSLTSPAPSMSRKARNRTPIRSRNVCLRIDKSERKALGSPLWHVVTLSPILFEMCRESIIC